MLQIVTGKDGRWSYTNPKILVPDFVTLMKTLPEIIAKLGPNQLENIFITVGHHSGVDAAVSPQRKHSTFEWQEVIPFDIDKCDKHRAFEYIKILADLLQINPTDMTAVWSGNGIQCYVLLKNFIRGIKYFKDNQAAYNEICRLFNDKCSEKGLPLDKMDPVVFEGARIMRMPCTINVKPDKEKQPDADGNYPMKRRETEVLQVSFTRLDLDLYRVSGLEQAERDNISPQQVRRAYPRPDFQEMTEQCEFIKWTLTAPEEVHEPQAFNLMSLMKAVNPSDAAIVDGKQLTALELSRHVFDSATSSASLAVTTFEKKWDGADRHGVRKCSTIGAAWDGCHKCPHFQKIPTPLALKSKQHISSEANGFWVINDKGHRVKPHYPDLVRRYTDSTSVVTITGERILGFDGKKYDEIKPYQLKAWPESVLVPSDDYTDSHAQEFVAKTKRMSTLQPLELSHFVGMSTEGKLNLKNGVLDLVTGELLPHSPRYNFMYVLPHEYHPDGVSELFMDWLADITIHRVDLMEALLDIMAYALWPKYDDHLFVFLAGEGSNGKSTYINILRHMIGAENTASISFQQLTKNRFSAANLEGKLVNLSGESSGYEIDIEETNRIKELSDGSTIEVERKGEQGFMMQNRAKLIFSVNTPPHFKDKSHSLARRLLVIPFDKRITDIDPTMQDRLNAEVSGILPMLVRRIQENIKRNKGSFKVHRGGVDAAAAHRIVLLKGDTVMEWAKDHIDHGGEIPMDSYVRVTECFNHYKEWCEKNGFKNSKNQIQFAKTMVQHYLTNLTEPVKVTKIGGESTRIYRQCRWKEIIK